MSKLHVLTWRSSTLDSGFINLLKLIAIIISCQSQYRSKSIIWSAEFSSLCRECGLEGSSARVAISVFDTIVCLAAWAFPYLEVWSVSIPGTSPSSVLDLRSIETYSKERVRATVTLWLYIFQNVEDFDGRQRILMLIFSSIVLLFDVCTLVKYKTNICQQKISTQQQRSSSQYHRDQSPDKNECNLPKQYDSGTIKPQKEELTEIQLVIVFSRSDVHGEKTSSEHLQQQRVEGHRPETIKPQREGLTEKQCVSSRSDVHEEKTLSEHLQQQRVESHHPETIKHQPKEHIERQCVSSRSDVHEENRPSSQHQQQQQNDTPKQIMETDEGVFEREDLTLHDEMDLDDNTDNFCSGDNERTTNELQSGRASSDHKQQQRLEDHHPDPNTPSSERRTRKRKRYNPDTQATPQKTHDVSKRRRVSNDQRKKHLYVDSGAAYHSTYDPSVIKLYPAHMNIKPPIQAIHGIGGSTTLVTGYGYIDCPGGKLKNVLLLPDSSANLVCVGQLTRDYPVKVVFYEDKCWIEGLHNGERIGEGHREGVNHYVLDRFHPDSLIIKKRKPSKKKARQYTR